MFKSLHKTLVAPQLLLTGSICLLSVVDTLYSQQQNHLSERTVVIGELVGRTDMRAFTLQTRNGEFLVSSSENHKPFDVFAEDANEVVVRFNSSPQLKLYNPQRLIFRFYETERALITALILGEVDVAELANERSAQEVQKSNPNFLPLPIRITENNVKMIAYNNRNWMLASRQLRTALSYGINHNYIIKRILGNKASIARGPYDDDSDWYLGGMNSYDYNPKRAIELLSKAGWRDSDGDGIRDKNDQPLELELLYQKGLRIDDQIARRVKIDMLQIGVNIKPKPLPMSTINDRLNNRDFDAVLIDHTFEENIAGLVDFFSQTSRDNFTGYSSQTFQNYLEFYRRDPNPATRETLVKSMQRVVNEDQPVTFLYFKWVTHYLINITRLGNYRNLQGTIRPYEEWVIRELIQLNRN